MFTAGKPADYLFIVVTGLVHRYHEIGGQWLVVATTAPGQVNGMLPFSRMTHYPSHAIAAEPTQVLRLHKNNFIEMLGVSEELGRRLVAEMSNRVRGDVRLEQQREKMASLGRLSAGLAHELNNPAAAISSTAASLTKRLSDQAVLNMALARNDIAESSITAIENSCAWHKNQRYPTIRRSNAVKKKSKLPTGWKNGPLWIPGNSPTIFTDHGISISDLDQFANAVPPAIIGNALAWIAINIEIDQMVGEINAAAGRVSELISSVKRYSHMDQSTEHKPVDVREGLDATLQMFGYKLKQKNITITRNYQDELPQISGYVGELNQVWTCLIDNAIDAMDENGKLGIEVNHTELNIDIKIIDNGKGIPENIRSSIFDPFFTTKGVGEGTGLGLDIAQRIVRTHRGQIVVESKPGQTVMLVQLPVG